MISAVRKSRLFEEHQISTEGRDALYAKLMLPKPPEDPKRLVFIAPLVGASAAQALVLFRSLTRRGSILMSFAYRGHTGSSGTFELDKTIVDVRHALAWACGYTARRGLPLHGFATCFGAIPLVAQFARGARGCPLWSFSTISGLFRSDQILRFETFVPVFSRYLGRRLDEKAMLDGIAEQALDLSGDAFRSALWEYLKGLFPELRVGRDYFEELQYDRADVPRTLLQLSRARYFDGLAFPSDIPCRLFFGRNDNVLGLHTEAGRQAYRDHVLSLIPHAEFREMEFDHYGRGPDHEPVLQRLGDLFEECERRAGPMKCTHQNRSVQGVCR